MKSSSLGNIHREQNSHVQKQKHVNYKIQDNNDKVEQNDKPNKVRPIILGSIDGLITSFVIIAAGIAGEVNKKSIILISLSSLIADAFSMGTSEYISSRSKFSARISFMLGFSCFVSFIIFGSIPLIGFVIAHKWKILVPALLFEIGLCIVACVSIRFTKNNLCYSLIEVLSVGSFAGFIAYFIAFLSS